MKCFFSLYGFESFRVDFFILFDQLFAFIDDLLNNFKNYYAYIKDKLNNFDGSSKQNCKQDDDTADNLHSRLKVFSEDIFSLFKQIKQNESEVMDHPYKQNQESKYLHADFFTILNEVDEAV